MLIVPLPGSQEGVVARRSVDGATERADNLGNQSSVVRRLRAGLVTPHSGGLGKLSGPTMGLCLEWLDAVRMKAGVSLPDRGPRRDPSAPGSTAPGTEIAAGGAPRGARAPQRARHLLKAASFGAPHPPLEGGKESESKDRRTRRLDKKHGDTRSSPHHQGKPPQRKCARGLNPSPGGCD